jgi:UDP-glucose 4-epimerase
MPTPPPEARSIGPGSRVVVTGGAGFIGSHLVEHLVATGASVTVVDDLSTGRLEHLQTVAPRVELVVGDLGDVLRLKRIRLEDYGFVFHLAGNAYIPPSVANPAFDFQANLRNTFALLEALRETPNAPGLVNASSAAVYGNPTCLPIRETDPTIPIAPYGVSKLAAERYVAVYSRLYGLRAVSVRLFSIYGPRQRKQVVYDLFCKLRANPKRLEILGDGSQARDFIYVLDVVQALMLVATAAPKHGEVYNVASGTTHTISELAEACCRVSGLRPEIVYTGQMRPGDAEKWEVDINLLRRLGFEARADLETGLIATQPTASAAAR